jgi:hypothetical protein
MKEKPLYRFSHFSFFLWTQFLKHINFLVVFWANRPFLLIYFNQRLTCNMLITIIYFKIIDSISILCIYLIRQKYYLSMHEINNIKLVHFSTSSFMSMQHRRIKSACVNNGVDITRQIAGFKQVISIIKCSFIN